jgi:YVTN family beta-propeller protein
VPIRPALKPFLAAACLVFLQADSLSAQAPYRIERRIPLAGTTGWDLLAMDSPAHRLYVSRGTHVDVVDTQSNTVTASIEGTAGVHGIAVGEGKVYTSNGASGTVSVLDAKTLKLEATLTVGEKPDGILYDAYSRRVFVFNGRSQDCSVIDAVKDTVIKTLPLPGSPELAAADGKGRLYVNLEDKSSVAVLDTKAMTVKAVWPLAPGEEPTGLGLDAKKHRIFSACANQKMIITDARTGKRLGEAPIGNGPDGAGFDPGTGLAFSSNGEGTLSVVQEKSKGVFEALESVPTQKGARTMALDPADHRIYLICAKYGEIPAGQEKEHQRPPILDGSVEVLVLQYLAGK